jgi:hypothetical protein
MKQALDIDIQPSPIVASGLCVCECAWHVTPLRLWTTGQLTICTCAVELLFAYCTYTLFGLVT